MEHDSKTPDTAALRQARKRERKRIRGLVRAEVWIPDTPEARQRLAECVEEIRRRHDEVAA